MQPLVIACFVDNKLDPLKVKSFSVRAKIHKPIQMVSVVFGFNVTHLEEQVGCSGDIEL